MKKIIISSLLLIQIAVGHTQNSILIAKSFEDDASQGDPSVISVSKAKSKDAVWIADLAAQYLVSSFTHAKHSITAEFHRNTGADDEVYNLQFGYSGQMVIKKWVDKKKPNNASTINLYPQLKYRYDKVEGAHGVSGSFIFSFFQQGDKRKMHWSKFKYNKDQSFGYRLEPTVGLEFQNNFKADSTIYRGFVGRTVAGINFRIGMFKANSDKPSVPDKKFIFSLSGTLRYDAAGKEYTDSRYHPLIKVAADWYIASEPVSIALGASFVYGDNPKEGFRKFAYKSQQLWLIGLKFQKE